MSAKQDLWYLDGMRGHTSLNGMCTLSTGETKIAEMPIKYAARTVRCVNACAGMKDPAAEIEALRANNGDDGACRLFLESIRTELQGLGFDDPDQSINGGDCCEYLGNLYNDIRESLEHAPSVMDDATVREYQVKVDSLRAKVAELAAALQAMNHMGGDERGGYCICACSDGSAPDEQHATHCVIARAALAKVKA